jgi:hypothetical protein
MYLTFSLHSGRGAVVKDQVYIRNAEAAQLAHALARETGKTITEIVLDALRQYRSAQSQPPPLGRIKKWRRLLRRDRGRLIQSEVPIEAFYNQNTGLPE